MPQRQMMLPLLAVVYVPTPAEKPVATRDTFLLTPIHKYRVQSLSGKL